MRTLSFSFLLLAGLLGSSSFLASAQNPDTESVNAQAPPVRNQDVIRQQPEPSASDDLTPLPEGGAIVDHVYINQYFGLKFPFGTGWAQKEVRPPPSDIGYYVLSQLDPGETFEGPKPGTILISAQDMFFGVEPVHTVLQAVRKKQGLLNAGYKVERQPVEVKIAGRTFYRMDYMSPASSVHWFTLTTEIRCHAVEFAMTSRDTSLLDAMVKKLEQLQSLDHSPASGPGDVPVCIHDYAAGDNITLKVDPIVNDRKFNRIPARIIIDKSGKVRHVHVLSAFPDQARIIIDALLQWEFKPHTVNGQLVEVETGIMFGPVARRKNLNKKLLGG
jgi:hypothetical protein